MVVTSPCYPTICHAAHGRYNAYMLGMRILSWMLLLGTAITSIVAGIFLSSANIGLSFMLSSGQLGTAGNWVLCLLAGSIGLSIFFLRGVDGGGWSVSAGGILVVLGTAVGLFLFGIYGLLALGVVSDVSAPAFIKKRNTGAGQ